MFLHSLVDVFLTLTVVEVIVEVVEVEVVEVVHLVPYYLRGIIQMRHITVVMKMMERLDAHYPLVVKGGIKVKRKKVKVGQKRKAGRKVKGRIKVGQRRKKVENKSTQLHNAV